MRGRRRGAHIRVGVALGIGLAALTACGGTNSNSSSTPESQLLTAGLAAQTAGHNQQATADFQAVLKQDPANKYALYDLGLIDQNLGNATVAAALYRAALVSDPNYVPALFNLAIVRTRAAPYEAVDLYRHALALQPSYAAAHLNLGYVLRSLGQVVEGNTEIARALVLQPSLAATPSPSAKPSPSP